MTKFQPEVIPNIHCDMTAAKEILVAISIMFIILVIYVYQSSVNEFELFNMGRIPVSLKEVCLFLNSWGIQKFRKYKTRLNLFVLILHNGCQSGILIAVNHSHYMNPLHPPRAEFHLQHATASS